MAKNNKLEADVVKKVVKIIFAIMRKVDDELFLTNFFLGDWNDQPLEVKQLLRRLKLKKNWDIRQPNLEAENIVREIANLCPNCRNLSDAISIASGDKETSTNSGCEKCWVDRLQNENKQIKEILHKHFICPQCGKKINPKCTIHTCLQKGK